MRRSVVSQRHVLPHDNVDVQTNARVKEVKSDRIIFTQKTPEGETVTKELPMGFCLWSTGVSQTEFSQKLAKKLGDNQTNKHALETDTHLRLTGAPLGDVYAIGGLLYCPEQRIRPHHHFPAHSCLGEGQGARVHGNHLL